MEQSANLQLAFIMPSQAQKHVTHNEAIRTLDALVQLAVLDRDLPVPPGSPADGDRYLVAAGSSGAWAGREGKVAAWQDGAWTFFAPKAGWLLWVADEARLLSFDGSTWIDAAVHSVNPAPLVGVNTTADAVNRLSVRGPASLFDEEAGDHRIKINKAAAGDTASLVFQTGYSGRAEFGLAGDDDWHVKVSADGSAWTEAMKVDRTTGRVTLPSALPLADENQVVARRHVREKLAANRTYYVRPDGSDSNDGLADSSGGAFLTIQKALDEVAALDIGTFDVTIQLGDGTYTAGSTVSGPWVGTGNVIVQGNASTPGNVIVSVGASSQCFLAQNGGARLKVQHMDLQSSGSGSNGLYAVNGGTIIGGAGLRFGAFTSGRHIFATGAGSNIQMTAAYTIQGSALNHALAENLASVFARGFTITVTGTLGFSSASGFVRAQFSATIDFATSSFDISGATVTGRRYNVNFNGVVYTVGGGASFFPGDSAGTTAAGGQYA